MDYEQMNNNKVYIRGEITDIPQFDHEVFDEKFYLVHLRVPRLSESFDIIPITISERLMENKFKVGEIITVCGQFRSYNKQLEGKSKLLLTVFVREILENDFSQNPNIIELTGFVCKLPIFRTTPFKREICDVLLAVNRAYNKSDYIPCIAWGRNARFVKDMKVGEELTIVGRIQSREYQKKLSDDQIENHTAYEISIAKLSEAKNGDFIPTNANGNFANVN